MKNITVTVEDEIYRAARIAAARRKTSVSALVRDYLTSLDTDKDSPEEATRALFAAMDNARDLRAADRLSRDQAHER